MKQRAGIVEHHPRLFAFVDEVRNELAHALVAPVEDRRVVVVADTLVLHHVLQIADDRGGVKIGAAGRYQRLVHVQGDGSGAEMRPKSATILGGEDALAARGLHRLFDQAIRSRRCSGVPSTVLRQSFHDELRLHSVVRDAYSGPASFVTNVVVDIQIVLTGTIPGMIMAHSVDHEVPKFMRVGEPKTKGTLHR